jgi:hypothetical protein
VAAAVVALSSSAMVVIPPICLLGFSLLSLPQGKPEVQEMI